MGRIMVVADAGPTGDVIEGDRLATTRKRDRHILIDRT